MKGTTKLEIWPFVTSTVSATALPLSLTLSVFELAVALIDSVPASPLRLPVFVGALLDTLIVSPAPVLILVVPPARVLCTLTVSVAVPVERLMPPPKVPPLVE